MQGKNYGKDPHNTGGNMHKAKKSGTPPDAVGRSGGGSVKIISPDVHVTKVSKKELTKGMS